MINCLKSINGYGFRKDRTEMALVKTPYHIDLKQAARQKNHTTN